MAAIAVGAWMALDLFSPERRRRSLSLGFLGITAGLWAFGDLLELSAHAPQQIVIARSFTYVGACFIGACWLWVSLQAARPRWWVRRPWLIALAFVPSALFYSCVYWDHQGWFVDWATHDRGPLFIAHTAWSWSLIAIGIAGFGQAARRLRKASRARMIVLLVGTLTPLVGNAIYLVYGTPIDPTPLLLGFGGLLIRYAIVDAGMTFFLPLGRNDVVEQLEVGVVVADLENTVVDANQASHVLLDEEKLVGRPLGELLDAVEANPNRALERRCFPLRNGRAIVGTGVVIEDRTEARRAEQRLQLAARLETVGSLTAGIAHEVNNPLAYVSSNLSQLEKLTAALARPEVLDRLPQDVRWLAEDGSEMVRDASDGMRRIADLVDRLRRFARDEPDPPTPQRLDLAQVSRTAVAMARVGAPPNAIRTRFEASPPVDAIESDLVQIAINLLVNAIQAADGDPRIDLEVLPWDGGTALRVLDRGPGIPDDALPRIFDPFFTTKLPGQGTGLGLSLSYDLAHRHGGRLEAENRPGGGAAFTLWLPAGRPDAA